MDSSALTLPQVTLGFMMLATMLTVVAGWVKMSERMARMEAHVETLLKKSTNRRSEITGEND